MGYTPRRRLFAVELPLALPAVVAGLRVATVSTVSLVSVGGALGLGGLGFMFFHGYRRDLQSEILAGIIASVVLAVVLDLVIVLAGRILTPWARKRAAR
jgi:osmoprotectant transport system permease protein